ncbi:hypothetical protein FRB96_002474 [Tulasnella sp. 330]|nr:hypothetical protein FRB96_002474 [Tulasnella sp. 330]
MAVLSPRIQITLGLIATITFFGTLYSYRNDTYLDTSNPLLAALPHPAHGHSFLASKKNILNQWFVKKAWGWTSLAFWAVWLTAPEGSSVKDGFAIGRWLGATAVWVLFVGWFFGPSLFDRIGDLSGRECVVILPSNASSGGSGPAAAVAAASETLYSSLTVPAKFCLGRVRISPESHPALFAHTPQSMQATTSHIPEWTANVTGSVPRFYRGHDVSGHTFLLTLSVLLLVDHLVRARRPARVATVGKGSGIVQHTPPSSPLWLVSLVGSWALVGLWMVMLGATAVYFHTWEEKLSGFLIAIVGYFVSQYPFDPTPISETSTTTTQMQDVPPKVTKVE